MKLKLAVVLLMIAAISIGFYIGRLHPGLHVEHGHPEPELSEAIAQTLEGMESFSGAEAARDVRAIEFIESGETKRAVQMLSHPIADHYYWYAIYADTDRRRKSRAMIEQLVSTNRIVADELSNQAHYYEIHPKTQ